MNNILCKCREHKAIQQYLQSSLDPDLGKKEILHCTNKIQGNIKYQNHSQTH